MSCCLCSVYTGSSQTLQSDCPPEADADACGEICKAEWRGEAWKVKLSNFFFFLRIVTSISTCSQSLVKSVIMFMMKKNKKVLGCYKSHWKSFCYYSRTFLDQRKLHVCPRSLLMLSLKGWETMRSPSLLTGDSREAKEMLGSQISKERWRGRSESTADQINSLLLITVTCTDVHTVTVT